MRLIWTLTDGKAGDAAQCLGVAELVAAETGARIEERIVRPRPPFVWAMPWGPVDPRDRDVLARPWPDLAIASGRRAVAYLRRLKRLSPGTFTVFLKDPRTGAGAADLIWVPEHDRLRGPNVLVTPTAPHRLSPARLAGARAGARPELAGLPAPRVAVLLGGVSKDTPFDAGDAAALAGSLARLAADGASLMVTPSRRTPPRLIEAVRAALALGGAWIWDGAGANPYAEMLGLADAVVVTADSTNMLGEAVATGKPVLVFMPARLNPKITRFVDILTRHGAVAKLRGRLETLAYQPLDSTPLIAREILARAAARQR